MPSFSCTVEESVPSAARLDRYVAETLKILSRSQIKSRGLSACVNGKPVKISRPLKGGDKLELFWTEAESPFLIPENIPLDVVYEDARVIVINKAQGMVVHPGAGNRTRTVANALFYMMRQRSGDESVPAFSGLRPGIVHRLDKDTSGVMIAAWDEEALAFLGGQFKARKVRKSYAAIVLGCPKEASGSIDKKIVRSRRNRKIFAVSDSEGRRSLTHFKVLRSWGDFSLLHLMPKTGRTHQIRVHLKYLGNPIVGDPLYGQSLSRFKNSSLMLHAKNLSLFLPDSAQMSTFKTHLPPRFKKIIRALEVCKK
ncbi:MAG: RluA family pseudouridine synthase [Treponema sp.]|jgi:23S rRNA pseudouridine1911/1915/1917 synthase|nr:RluA family pseudouridine synthase [Treponema sp.]